MPSERACNRPDIRAIGHRWLCLVQPFWPFGLSSRRPAIATILAQENARPGVPSLAQKKNLPR